MNSNGIIIRQISGFFDVKTDTETVMCSARGKFKKDKFLPLVGDKVVIEKDEKVIIKILPRKNQIKRPAVSNIDYLCIVVAPAEPNPDFFLLDKLLISAAMNNVIPAIVINKVDLSDDKTIELIEAEYRGTGLTIHKTSCYKNLGVLEITNSFDYGIIALAGQSGVGKSSLLNLMCPGVRQEVGVLSLKTTAGRHTTIHSQLIPLPNGAMIIDTPGFSSVEVDNIRPTELERYYQDFEPYLGQCRFNDCIHDYEPDCFIKKMVEEKHISIGRYNRYIEFLRKLNDKTGGLVL